MPSGLRWVLKVWSEITKTTKRSEILPNLRHHCTVNMWQASGESFHKVFSHSATESLLSDKAACWNSKSLRGKELQIYTLPFLSHSLMAWWATTQYAGPNHWGCVWVKKRKWLQKKPTYCLFVEYVWKECSQRYERRRNEDLLTGSFSAWLIFDSQTISSQEISQSSVSRPNPDAPRTNPLRLKNVWGIRNPEMRLKNFFFFLIDLHYKHRVLFTSEILYLFIPSVCHVI